MIPSDVQQRLRLNWGERADAMLCNIECRIYDPESKWEWFIYAQDPDDTDCLLAIECDFFIEAGVIISKSFLESLYNHDGEEMKYDEDFKPRNALLFWKKLKRSYPQ